MAGGTATVTFLFVDLVGSTDLLHRIGDDANDELTRRYQAIMREAVERHGGSVLRTMGDGLIVVFEHSVAAALSTAIDMHRAIDRMGRADPLLRLQIRVGLSVGEASKMDGDWSGTPIFEAARLESKARPGTILVNDVMRVLIGNRGGFEFTPVGALELKGFPEPLPAAEVAWEPDPGRPEVPLASALEVGLDWPLVGREVELQRLRDAWAAAAAGEPSIVAVTGDGGIGKTRLVAELAVAVQRGEAAPTDRAPTDATSGATAPGGEPPDDTVPDGLPGGTVLYGRAGADPGPPLGAFAEALRWWAASVPPDVLRDAVGDDAPVLVGVVPSLAARLPELLGGGVAADAAELADAVARVMDRATEATGAWLVIVDAAHSADEATFDLMTRITQGDLAVLVVAVGREPGRFAAAERIELSGLDATATGRLLGEVTAHAGLDDPTDDVVARAHAETSGNPRLIIEAGERLVASGAMGLDEGAGRDEVVRRAITGVSPYKGLLAYQADDAEDFFGRDTDIAALLARVAASRLLAVVGASGSGKSSLVRAGLLPALRRGALAGSAEWPQVLFNAGPRPLLELAAGVAGALNQPAGEVMSALEAGAGGLDEVLRSATVGGTRPARVVIVVDQFEEIFTACQDDAERERFAETLLHAATVPDGRALVIAVMRSDFFGHCAELPGLAAALESTTVLLGPMDEAALRAVIEGPARRADLTLEPGLADTMIHDVAGEPGGLPLLSHALYETWERREHRSLTLAGYRDAGGARGAIARTAENVYSSQLDTDQQRIARHLFLDLTELGEGTEDTRRRAPRAALDERAGGGDRLAPVLDVLVGSRLVTVGDDTVEVAHEALIREWPRLRDWLDEDRETLRAMRHLSAAAAEWDRGGRDPADLYRGPRLVAALDASTTTALTDRDQQFLAASRDVEEAELRRQRAQNRRLRRSLAGVGVLLVLALIAGVVAFQQRSTANAERAEADQRTEDADFQRLVSQAADLADSNPSLAMLLALEADDQRDNPPSRSALLTTLQRNRDLLGYSPTEGIATGATLVDDRTLAYGTQDGTLGFLDLDRGEPAAATIALGPTPDDRIRVHVAEDPSRAADDPIVAARADTGQVFVVDPVTHEVIGEPIENDQAVLALAASTRLGLVAAGREDGTTALYDLATGERAGQLAPQEEPTEVRAPSPVEGANGLYGAGDAIVDDGDPIALAFSPTERRLALLRPDASVEFWDPARRDLIAASEREEVLYAPELGLLAYRPDGGQVFAYDAAVELRTLQAVDTTTARADWSDPFLARLAAASYSLDGREVLVTDTGGAVTPWDSETGTRGRVLVDPHLGAAASVSLAEEGRQLVFTSRSQPTVGRWALDGDGPLVTPLAGTVGSVPQQIAPDSSTVLLTDAVDAGGYRVWDPVGAEPVGGDTGYLLAGYSGDRTLVGFFDDLTAGQYDIDGERRIPPAIELTIAGVTTAIISPQAGMVAIGYEDGTVVYYDRSGTQPYPPLHTDGAAYIQALSDDGRLVAVTTAGDVATVYETETGREVAGPVRGVRATAFGADEKTLFAATIDGRLVELELPSLRPVPPAFPTLGAPGSNLNISDDGSLVQVNDSSNRLTVYDAVTRTPIGDPFVLGDPADTLNGELAPNGRFLVLGTADGVETWDLVPEHWRDIACRLAGRNLTQEEWDTYLPNAGAYERTCEEWPAGD